MRARGAHEPRRKIVLLIDSLHPYGAGRVALELAAAFAPDAAVTVVTFKGSAADNAARVPVQVGHAHLSVPLRRLGRLFVLAVRLGVLLRRSRPDVVLSFMPYANSVAAIACAVTRVPLVATEHTVMSVARYGGRERPLLHMAMRLYLRQVAAIVAVSQAVADDLVANFGAKPKRLFVIYNPLSFSRLRRSADAGAELIPPRRDGEIRIVMVASLKKQKGHELALRALTMLPASYTLYAVGDGPDADALIHAARALAVEERVRFVGWQEHAAAWLEDADVVWVPSAMEGFGLTLVEAWALGTPVVPTASPGLREVAEFLRCATVDPGDPEALSAATLNLREFTPPANLKARQHALRELVPEHVAKKYRHVLDGCCGVSDQHPQMTVALIQSALGDYRAGFLRELGERLGGRLLVAAGLSHFDETVVLLSAEAQTVVPLRNIYLFRRRVLWQGGAFAVGVRAGVAVLEFNPRILSVWATLVARRFKGRRTILWGHAFPRRGPRGLGMSLRKAMCALADVLLVYTRSEAKAAAPRWPVKVISAPNALYSRRVMYPDVEPSPAGFIYVGRLAPNKKPRLMIEALAKAATDLRRDARLTVVGDGPLRDDLKAYAAECGVADFVTFRGHMTELRELRSLYGGAIASLSPGYAGLALTQSIGFGVPMIISREEPHAPEIEAAREGENALFFDSDDADSLGTALLRVAARRDWWIGRREEIARHAHSYSTEAMAQAFVDVIDARQP